MINPIPPPLAGVVDPDAPHYRLPLVQIQELLAEFRLDVERQLETRQNLPQNYRNMLWDRWQRICPLQEDLLRLDPSLLPYLYSTAQWLREARQTGIYDALTLRLRQEPVLNYNQELDFTLFYGNDEFVRKRLESTTSPRRGR